MTAPATGVEGLMRDWVCDGPFRCELLGCDRLDDLAHELARLPTSANPSSRTLLRRLRDNAKRLRRARNAAATATVPLTPDAEWLLDNFYVIEDVIREVKTDLPSGYYAELPVATDGPWAGLPRIYAIAVALISCTDSHLDDAQILRFVQAYQTVSPLATGELWAVPTMLRLALLENLRRLADDYLAGRGEEESQAVGPSTSSLNQVSIGNSVTSLRLLNAIDWAVFFEAASPVEAVLRAEPTGVYLAQDFPTRDRYRQVVERLAKAAKRDEAEVARLAVARAAAATDPRTGHIGYHLVAGGRPAFAAELGCRFKFRERLQQFLLRHPYPVYFGLLGAITAAGVTVAVGLAVAAGAAAWVCVLVGLLALLPASEVAVALTHTLITRLLPPRVLSKFDFLDGIPAEWRTVVVIPGMLTRPDSAANLAERLELHYLANPDPQLRFALLTDWSDAPTETAPTDAGLVQAAVDAIRRLNERYFPGEEPRFFLFHRRRLFNPAEGVWMGWERKRGKLDEFNRLLRGANDTTYAFQTCDAAKLNARFVLTLDADTVLPRDAARRLVGTLAHPLNRPVLSADGRRVVAGYGVLQPRVSYLFRTGLRSRFARTFAGSAGIDPYSAAASDVYQDLFGEGTFTGKGLYDVDAFHATAGRAFPENAILSHDLIESTFARCGLVTDIELFDDFPAKYLAFARREHRWARGDWQLLPWLGRRVMVGSDPVSGSSPALRAPTRRPRKCFLPGPAGRRAAGLTRPTNRPERPVAAFPVEGVRQPSPQHGTGGPGSDAGGRLGTGAGGRVGVDAARAGGAGAAAGGATVRLGEGVGVQLVFPGGGRRPGTRPADHRLPDRAHGVVPGEPGDDRRRRGVPHAVPAVRLAEAPAGVGDGRRRRGSAERRVGDGHAVDAAGGRARGRGRGTGGGGSPGRPAGRAAVAACVDCLPAGGVVGESAAAGPRAAAFRRGAGRVAHDRPQDVAVLRDVRRGRRPLAAAGQLPGRPEGRRRPPHLADERRAAAAVHAVRPRPRLPAARGGRRPAAEDVRHPGPAGNVPGPLPQLV
ncbi:MAG: hypothetical protein U0871_19035 [Gemmataceae bacterium]